MLLLWKNMRCFVLNMKGSGRENPQMVREIHGRRLIYQILSGWPRASSTCMKHYNLFCCSELVPCVGEAGDSLLMKLLRKIMKSAHRYFVGMRCYFFAFCPALSRLLRIANLSVKERVASLYLLILPPLFLPHWKRKLGTKACPYLPAAHDTEQHGMLRVILFQPNT